MSNKNYWALTYTIIRETDTIDNINNKIKFSKLQLAILLKVFQLKEQFIQGVSCILTRTNPIPLRMPPPGLLNVKGVVLNV